MHVINYVFSPDFIERSLLVTLDPEDEFAILSHNVTFATKTESARGVCVSVYINNHRTFFRFILLF